VLIPGAAVTSSVKPESLWPKRYPGVQPFQPHAQLEVVRIRHVKDNTLLVVSISQTEHPGHPHFYIHTLTRTAKSSLSWPPRKSEGGEVRDLNMLLRNGSRPGKYNANTQCASTSEIAISPQFLTLEHHFVRKGCAPTSKIAISPQFLTLDHHFVRKGCVRPPKSQFHLSF